MARALIAALLALGLLTGCGGEDEAPSGAPEPSRPISFQLFGDPEEIAIYEELVKAYERKTAGEVDLIVAADRKDHLAKLTASFAARRAPEVFLLNYRNMGGYADRGVLEPVERRVEDLEAFYPVAVDAFRYDGTLQCLPQNVSSLVVYFNEDKVDAVPEDFEGFRALAREVGVGVDPGTIRAAAFIWGGGGELTDDPVEPTKFAFGPDDRGLQALLSLAEFAPSATEEESKPSDERFIEGELGMFLSSRREVPLFRTIEAFEWDVAGFPTIAEPATVLHSDGFCMAKGAGAESAWRFVEFASSPEGQQILSRGGRTVPSRRAVAESSAFLDPSRPPESDQVFLDQIEVMRALPTTKNWTAVEEAADDALSSAFYGRLTPEQAVERIHEETDGRF